MMNYFTYPAKQDWQELVKRPAADNKAVEETVRTILVQVRAKGDIALRNYTKEFDGIVIDALAVSEQEIENAVNFLNDELKAAIQQAKQNIELFHQAQQEDERVIETAPGISCWRKASPIERV